MMDLARARDIVIAICNRSMVEIDPALPLDPLKGVSLAEMIEAKRLVENTNAANKAAAAFSGGRYTLNVVPDDRLIAAVYTLENYAPSRTCILAVPLRAGSIKVLAVIAQPVGADADNEMDHALG